MAVEKTHKGQKGGLLSGQPHSNGGIKAVVTDTDRHVELEGGEAIVNKKTMKSPETFEFEGEDKTPCEIISDLNQLDGNGVPISCDKVEGASKGKFADGGSVPNIDFLPKEDLEQLSYANLKAYKQKLSDLSRDDASKWYYAANEFERNNPMPHQRGGISQKQWKLVSKDDKAKIREKVDAEMVDWKRAKRDYADKQSPNYAFWESKITPINQKVNELYQSLPNKEKYATEIALLEDSKNAANTKANKDKLQRYIDDLSSESNYVDRLDITSERNMARLWYIGAQQFVAGLIRKLGGKRYHKSDKGAKGSIYYELPNMDKVRISDHELPMTEQREYNQSVGIGGKWINLVLDEPKPFTELKEDILETIEYRLGSSNDMASHFGKESDKIRAEIEKMRGGKMAEGGKVLETPFEINDLGGYDYTGDAKKTAKEVDLLSLPRNINGTNCTNCLFFKGGFCANKAIMLPVNDKMCCALWDSVGSERSWYTPNPETQDVPSKVEKFELNDLGGYNYTGKAKEIAKKYDLITLPKSITGTNCGNCGFYTPLLKGGFCFRHNIQLPVTTRMSCAYWANFGTEESWGIFEEGGSVEPLLAPNGKPSNLTPEQYALVRTPAFKAWFGDWQNDPKNSSKVVDENGEPLVVYHGTTNQFTAFDKNRQNTATGFGDFGAGFYLTSSKGVARYYTLKDKKSGIIMEVFLNVRNPFMVELNWEKLTPKTIETYNSLKYLTEHQKNVLAKGIQEELRPSKYISKELGDFVFQDILSKNGYDGVFVNRINIHEIKNVNFKDEIFYLHEIVVNDPTQIKLADGSNTTFDSSNPDIRFAKGGNISKTPAPKKEQITGSDTNKKGSAADTEAAKEIVFSKATEAAILNKVNEYNKEYRNKKVTLEAAKAVVRRGMGAYSSSHRPTISEGRPNNRVAWGLARLDAFLYKIANGRSRSGKYNQDDDLIMEMGHKVEKYKDGGFTEEQKPIGLTWEEVPMFNKYASPVKPIKYELVPGDAGLQRILKNVVSTDDLRPAMTGINFDQNGVAATDAHKLVFFPDENLPNKYYGIHKGNEKINARYPDYMAILYNYKRESSRYTVDVLALKTFVEVSLDFTNRITKQIVLKFGDSEIKGFNGDFLIEMCDFWMSIGHRSVDFLSESNSSKALFVVPKDGNPIKDITFVIMPVYLDYYQETFDNPVQKDLDLQYKLSCTYDVSTNLVVDVYTGKTHAINTSYVKADQVWFGGVVSPEMFRALKAAFSKISVLPIFEYVAITPDKKLFAQSTEAAIALSGVNEKPGLYHFGKRGLIRISEDSRDAELYNEILEMFADKINDKGNTLATIMTADLAGVMPLLSEARNKDQLASRGQGIDFTIEGNDKVVLQATNNYILAINTLPSTNKTDNDTQLQIADNILSSFIDLANGSNCNISTNIQRDASFVCFDFGSMTIFETNLDGKKIDGESILPEKLETVKTLKVNAADVQAFLRQAKPSDKKALSKVNFVDDGAKVKITAFVYDDLAKQNKPISEKTISGNIIKSDSNNLNKDNIVILMKGGGDQKEIDNEGENGISIGFNGLKSFLAAYPKGEITIYQSPEKKWLLYAENSEMPVISGSFVSVERSSVENTLSEENDYIEKAKESKAKREKESNSWQEAKTEQNIANIEKLAIATENKWQEKIKKIEEQEEELAVAVALAMQQEIELLELELE